MPQKILVIEDEPPIADTIIYALKTEGFTPVWAATGGDGKNILARESIELVILDIGLPDMSGIDVCREIRRTSSVPIIFLTARNDEIDRVVGLEIGGDDYMSKPFSPRELTARVRAILRRTNGSSDHSTVCSPPPASPADDTPPFHVDTIRKVIHYFGTPLELTKCEFNLLLAFIDHPGHVYSRDALKQIAWDEPDFSLDRTVDTHIKTLRGKLRAVAPDSDPIETRRGFGYAMRES